MQWVDAIKMVDAHENWMMSNSEMKKVDACENLMISNNEMKNK